MCSLNEKVQSFWRHTPEAQVCRTLSSAGTVAVKTYRFRTLAGHLGRKRAGGFTKQSEVEKLRVL